MFSRLFEKIHLKCVFANKGAKRCKVFAFLIVIPTSVLRVNSALIHLINTVEPIKSFVYMACIFKISEMFLFINYMIVITICNNYIWNAKCIGKATIWLEIR